MNREEFMKQLEELLQKIPASEREDALAYYNDYFDEAGAENESQVIMELGSPDAVAENILANVQQETVQNTRQDYCSPESEETQEYVNEPEENQDSEENKSLEEQKNSEENKSSEENKTSGEYQSQASSQSSTSSSGMNQSTKILLILLLVFTFPLWIGLVGGLFGTLVGLLGAAFGVMVGIIGAAIGCVVGGIACILGGIACLLVNPAEGLICIGVGAILAALGLLLALLGIFAVGVWLPKLIKGLINWIKGLFHRNEGGNEI